MCNHLHFFNTTAWQKYGTTVLLVLILHTTTNDIMLVTFSEAVAILFPSELKDMAAMRLS